MLPHGTTKIEILAQMTSQVKNHRECIHIPLYVLEFPFPISLYMRIATLCMISTSVLNDCQLVMVYVFRRTAYLLKSSSKVQSISMDYLYERVKLTYAETLHCTE